MQRRPQRVLAASAAALTAVTLAACASSDRDSGGGEGGGGEAQSGGTMVFGATGDPAMLDPAFGSDGETFRVSRQIFEGLLGNELGGTDPVPELAGAHPAVSFTLTGLNKDDRVVRVTVGVELGPRAAVARFSPQAQAAYAFVSSVFTTLYDHMPVYTAEPSGAERAAAAALLERATGSADLFEPAGGSAAEAMQVPAPVPVPIPRLSGPGERVPA